MPIVSRIHSRSAKPPACNLHNYFKNIKNTTPPTSLLDFIEKSEERVLNLLEKIMENHFIMIGGCFLLNYLD